ncbi:LysR substrate-binding domain-containing protein [Streptomyces sp. KL116D]|uniref:LysR substrate-binding domain-containing protein n=1 Tax=Streptomyces sp. KL116D TaxID=3045152 RepID=UPI003557349E
MAQPPLSRAIQQLERRLGVSVGTQPPRRLSDRRRGAVARAAQPRHATAPPFAAAPARAGGAETSGGPRKRLCLAVKAGASHELLHKLLDAYAAEPDAVDVEVCRRAALRDQEGMLRDGRADVALMHAPFNSLAGFDSEELMTEGQIAVLLAGHRLAAQTPCPERRSLSTSISLVSPVWSPAESTSSHPARARSTS